MSFPPYNMKRIGVEEFEVCKLIAEITPEGKLEPVYQQVNIYTTEKFAIRAIQTMAWMDSRKADYALRRPRFFDEFGQEIPDPAAPPRQSLWKRLFG